MNKRKIGAFGEDLAIDFLKSNGYEIIDRNFRYSRLGEIDIIAREKEYICFIEVKSRTGNSFGRPSESVGYKKQKNIRKIAMIYLRRKQIDDIPLRFDIVEVYLKRCSPKINLLKNAF